MTAICTLHMDGLKNFESPWIRPRSLFSKILMGICSGEFCECTGQILKSVALPVPEIIAIEFLDGGCERPIMGKGRSYGVWDGTVRKSVGEFL